MIAVVKMVRTCVLCVYAVGALDVCMTLLLCTYTWLYYSYILLFILANKESLVVDYNFLANEQHVQVIAFFLPEAPTEMLKIFDEVLILTILDNHVKARAVYR